MKWLVFVWATVAVFELVRIANLMEDYMIWRGVIK